MTIKRYAPPPSEITPESTYLGIRRRAIFSSGALALGGLAIPRVTRSQTQPAEATQEERYARIPVTPSQRYTAKDALSPWNQVAANVLYHEFGEGAAGPLQKSWAMKTDPWSVQVEGEVHKPRRFGLEDLLKLAPMEERVHRHRCVGGWYMVVPWAGYPLAELIRRVEPTGNARYVEFTSHWDETIMANAFYRFPYIESLRLDEAMHPLTLLAFGYYGRVLPKQNGAPLRIVTPWKFAHKSPKAIVGIRFTEKRPQSFFYTQYGHLYGWYRNVHPDLAQGGSQRREKRPHEWFRSHDTPLLNGHADEVASLYGGELNNLR